MIIVLFVVIQNSKSDQDKYTNQTLLANILVDTHIFVINIVSYSVVSALGNSS